MPRTLPLPSSLLQRWPWPAERRGVGYPINRPIDVIGHKQRTVGRDQDIDRPAKIAVAFDKTGQKGLELAEVAVGGQQHRHHVGAELLGAIPGAVPRDEDSILVLGGELAAGVEAHAERGGVRAEADKRPAELAAGPLLVGGVLHVALVAIRKAEDAVRSGIRRSARRAGSYRPDCRARSR